MHNTRSNLTSTFRAGRPLCAITCLPVYNVVPSKIFCCDLDAWRLNNTTNVGSLFPGSRALLFSLIVEGVLTVHVRVPTPVARAKASWPLLLSLSTTGSGSTQPPSQGPVAEEDLHATKRKPFCCMFYNGDGYFLRP